MRSSANLQSRYEAYARNHGMTSEQMRTHDKRSHPDTMLTPYLFWLNLRRLDWNQSHPDHLIHSGAELGYCGRTQFRGLLCLVW